MLWYSKNYLRSLEMWLKVNLYPIPNVDFFFSATDCWVTAHLLVFFPQADEEYLLQYPIKNTSYGTLHTRTLGLRFQVCSNTTTAQKKKMKLWHFEKSLLSLQAQRQHFSPEDGDMKLKCTASIGDIYWQVNEKSAEGFKSKRHSNTVYNTFVREQDGGPQGESGM